MGMVACGLLFYVAYFLGLMVTASTGPLNPANAPRLQSGLRYVALPVSVAAGLLVFALAFRRYGRQ